MVAPTSGPVVEIRSLKGSPTSLGYAPTVFYERKERYKQARPYNLPLPYSYTRKSVRYVSTDPSYYKSADLNPYGLGYSNSQAQLIAYNRARYDIVEGANIGVNLGERKQALNMMGNRLQQLAHIAKALRRGSVMDDLHVAGPQAAERYRRLSRANKARLQAKEFSNRWLEFHFGWEPLVKDVYATTELLDSPFPYFPYRGHGVSRHGRTRLVQRTDTPTNYTLWTNTNRVKFTMCYGGFMRVNNPNLHLANQLGLINPAVVAWELVPYSFVVDWFVGIGDYLRSFTDWVGLTLENPYSFSCAEALESESYLGINYYVDIKDGVRKISTEVSSSFTKTTYQFGRGQASPSMPGPRFTLPQRLSPTRGLTAASLLLKELKLR